MPNKTQAEYTRLFENIGAAVSGFKRYLEAANLVGSSAFFAIPRRDEFKFFTDPADQLKKVKNLKREIGYSGADDLLRLEISEVTPGVSFSLKFVLVFAGTVIATAAGQYDTDVTITPQLGQDLAPVGSIKVKAPTGTPGADQQVEIQIIASAPRQLWDVTGETEGEQLTKATAQEAHGIVAESLRTLQLDGSRTRVFNDRVAAEIIGEFLGSSNAVLFEENQQEESDGSVTAAPAGLLVELDNAMAFNTPVQTVKEIATSTVTFNALAPGGSLGDFTVSPTDPAPGTLRLDCIRGFIGGGLDPEQFRVSYRSEFLNRTLTSEIPYSVFRQYVWPRAGLTWTLKRKTTSTDTFARMTVPELSLVNDGSVGLNKLVATYVKPGGINNPLGRLTIRDPKRNVQVFSRNGSLASASPHRFNLSNGGLLTFTWVENPSVADGTTETWDINIFPYVVGDIVEAEITQTAAGLLQLEMRRNFDFGFSQSAGAPTIGDGSVSPDLPFVKPFLGA